MINNTLKDTFFSKKHSLNCSGKLLSLETPKIMGILNVGPDSFYDGGRYSNPDEAARRVEEMLSQGADIIDIGAVSSKPGSGLLPVEEELGRLHPILQRIVQEFPGIILSLDTYNAEVARVAIEDYRVSIINDISAGEIDSKMFSVIEKHKVPYIMMHMKGLPASMQDNPVYDNIIDEIIQYFSMKVSGLERRGVSDILLDPGFGFGKTLDHNYELLSGIDSFRMFKLPIVAGVSRKSMIHKLLDIEASTSLNGTTALHMVLLQKGVDILRVHDIAEAREALRIFLEIEKYSK